MFKHMIIWQQLLMTSLIMIYHKWTLLHWWTLFSTEDTILQAGYSNKYICPSMSISLSSKYLSLQSRTNYWNCLLVASIWSTRPCIIGFVMSHSIIQVEGIDYMECILVWASICMPTGWPSDDQSFEKLGELMNDNNGKLLGLYDELSMLLAQMNVCHGDRLTS